MLKKSNSGKSKTIHKSRKDKEQESNYLKKRPVKIEDLEEFQGSIDEFIDRIGTEKPAYLYLKGQGLTHIWWHDDEKWFLNLAHQSKNKIKAGGWYTAKDLKAILEFHKRQGGKLYFDR